MIQACPLADLAIGSARRLDLDPPIAVFRVAVGDVYAIDDTCTHQDASLADGWLEGREVERLLHASAPAPATPAAPAAPKPAPPAAPTPAPPAAPKPAPPAPASPARPAATRVTSDEAAA